MTFKVIHIWKETMYFGWALCVSVCHGWKNCFMTYYLKDFSARTLKLNPTNLHILNIMHLIQIHVGYISVHLEWSGITWFPCISEPKTMLSSTEILCVSAGSRMPKEPKRNSTLRKNLTWKCVCRKVEPGFIAPHWQRSSLCIYIFSF